MFPGSAIVPQFFLSQAMEFNHLCELIYLCSCVLLGSYLLVITERECVGSYLGHPIFKVSSLKIIPCNHSLKNSTDEQVTGPLVFLFHTYKSSCCLEPFVFFSNFAEKDREWVFCPSKCSREDFWSVFLIWHKFNFEVTCWTCSVSFLLGICVCLSCLHACMCCQHSSWVLTKVTGGWLSRSSTLVLLADLKGL